MGKSWVYKRLKSGEIPSVKLGRSIKVKYEDLEQYPERQRYHPVGDEYLLLLQRSAKTPAYKRILPFGSCVPEREGELSPPA